MHRTGRGRGGRARPAPGALSNAIVPAKQRPCASQAPSFIRLPGRSASTATSGLTRRWSAPATRSRCAPRAAARRVRGAARRSRAGRRRWPGSRASPGSLRSSRPASRSTDTSRPWRQSQSAPSPSSAWTSKASTQGTLGRADRATRHRLDRQPALLERPDVDHQRGLQRGRLGQAGEVVDHVAAEDPADQRAGRREGRRERVRPLAPGGQLVEERVAGAGRLLEAAEAAAAGPGRRSAPRGRAAGTGWRRCGARRPRRSRS